MPVTVTHAFDNPIADDPDFTGTKPSHWNQNHVITGLGTAAEHNVDEFATAEQGALADTAVQPEDLGDLAVKDQVAVSDIAATGIPDNTKFLRGDMTWSSVAVGGGGGDMEASVYDPTGIADDAFDMANMVENTNAKVMTAAERTKLAGIEAAADVTDAGNVGAAIHGSTEKTTPVDADTVSLIDSAASNVLKKLSWTNIKAALKTYFDTLYEPIGGGGGGGSVPAGTVVPFAGSAAPTGWSLCDGGTLSRTTESTLFTAIGTTYGAGDGSTTFNKPDLRGRVVAGKDDMGGVAASRLTASRPQGVNGATLGAVGGEQAHTQTVNELVAHSHTSTTIYTSGSGTQNGTTNGRSNNAPFNINNTGGGEPFNVVQPTMILNYIIKL